MSPHEMSAYRERFDAAADVLGWTKHEVTEHHERQWDCSWTEVVWFYGDVRMLSEKDLSPGLAEWLIELAAEKLEWRERLG